MSDGRGNVCKRPALVLVRLADKCVLCLYEPAYTLISCARVWECDVFVHFWLDRDFQFSEWEPTSGSRFSLELGGKSCVSCVDGFEIGLKSRVVQCDLVANIGAIAGMGPVSEEEYAGINRKTCQHYYENSIGFCLEETWWWLVGIIAKIIEF